MDQSINKSPVTNKTPESAYREVLSSLGIERLTITQRNQEKLGQPGAKVIVCLSGFTETGGQTFGGMADEIVRQNPDAVVILVSTPGSSESTFTERALQNDQIFDAENYAKVVQVYLDQLDVRPDMVIGHSFGGLAALHIAAPNKILLAPAFGLTDKFILAIKMLVSKRGKEEVLDDKSSIFLENILGSLPEGFIENINKIPAKALQKVLDGIVSSKVEIKPGENIVGFASVGSVQTIEKRGVLKSMIVGDDGVIDRNAIPSEIPTEELQEGGHNAHLLPESRAIILEKINNLLKGNA